MNKKLIFAAVYLLCGFLSCTEASTGEDAARKPEPKHKNSGKYTTYKGLVMTGYQGWFNGPEDGSGKGWGHYSQDGKFEPGACSIEMWPDMSEYEKQYETTFTYPDGKKATAFSSYDYSTTDLHFKWMKQYGIDGAFMQRFITTQKSEKGKKHSFQVFKNAVQASKKHDRAIVAMYDLSGMLPGDENVLIEDWKRLVDELNIINDKKSNYLFHNGKPLVAIWGIGFADKGRKYGFKEVKAILDFLQNDPQYGGCSIMVGIPTCWRTPAVADSDCTTDPALKEVIDRIDIIAPWHVDRYRKYFLSTGSYDFMLDRVKDDIAWCKARGKDYVPGIYPGFSMLNMKKFGSPDNPKFINWSPRLKGKYMWMMVQNAVKNGAEMLYAAMFDEIDEGTAIFKVSDNPPASDPKAGGTYFFDNEGMPSDHYLWLAGQAGKMLRGEIPFTPTLPERK